MIILGAGLFLLSCFAIGRALMRTRDSALAFGLGCGVVSYLFFVFKWLLPESNFAVVQWIVFAVALGNWGRRKISREISRNEDNTSRNLPPSPISSLDRALYVLFAAGCVVAAYIGLREVIALPHGEWDGWAIWNLHARFLARGGADWVGLFSPNLSWSHGDYPLMLPGLIAAGWRFTSSETVLIPAAITLLFCVATVAALVGAADAENGRTPAVIGGLILVATPKFWLNGTIQTADIPLGFFVLATVVLLWRSDKTSAGDYFTIALAGLAASLAAWTKNEGLLFVAALVPVRLFFRFIKEPLARVAKEAAAFAAGAAPGLVILFCFKIFLSPASEFSGAFSVDRFFDLGRYREVVGLMGRYGPAFGGDNGISPAWMLIPSLILLGPRIRSVARNGFASMIALSAVMVVGYSMVYQISPHPLEWHIWSSFDRLLIQLWPAFLFAFFASIGSALPADAGAGRSKWAYAAASAAVAFVAFWAVARTLPTPGPVPVAAAGAKTAHFFQVLATSGLRSGWAHLQVSTAGPVAAWLIQSYSTEGFTTEAITSPVSPAMSGVIPIVDQRKVGIAMVNPNESEVRVEASCNGGETVSFTIPPLVKVAAFVGDVPFNIRSCSRAFRFEASAGIGAAAFLTSETSGREALMELPVYTAERLTTGSVHVPYVVTSRGGTAVLVLTNPQDTPSAGRYFWYDEDGAELGSNEYLVRPRSSEQYILSGKEPGAGRVDVIPNNGAAPDALAILRDGTTVKGQAAGAAFRLLVEADEKRLLDSSLSLVNPGGEPATIQVETSGVTQTIVVPPRSQVIELLATGQSRTFSRVASNQPIVVTVLRNRRDKEGPFLISTAPPIEERPPDGNPMRIFPHVAVGRGYESEFALATPARLELH